MSGANYLGEIVEWFGYAVATWSLPALAFAVFSLCFIGPRAYYHHRSQKTLMNSKACLTPELSCFFFPDWQILSSAPLLQVLPGKLQGISQVTKSFDSIYLLKEKKKSTSLLYCKARRRLNQEPKSMGVCNHIMFIRNYTNFTAKESVLIFLAVTTICYCKKRE